MWRDCRRERVGHFCQTYGRIRQKMAAWLKPLELRARYSLRKHTCTNLPTDLPEKIFTPEMSITRAFPGGQAEDQAAVRPRPLQRVLCRWASEPTQAARSACQRHFAASTDSGWCRTIPISRTDFLSRRRLTRRAGLHARRKT